MVCNLEKAVNLLKNNDNIIIITHKNPDGDAIGSCLGLYFALIKMNKNVRVELKEIPQIYSWLFKDYNHKSNFDPEYIVSVDLADTKLLCDHLKSFETKIDLSIDHHISNKNYAKNTVMDINAASTTQILYNLISKLIGSKNIDRQIASSLYLGLSTDTGCFKYSSVSAKTHEVAAKLIEAGADYVIINKKMFDTKSKNRLMLERDVVSNIEYYFNDKCALIFISNELKDKYKISDDELEGLAVLPIQIEGVEIGITIKEKENEYKISIRTSEKYNASDICKSFGGGGHNRAAGCSMTGEYEKIKKSLISKISNFLGE